MEASMGFSVREPMILKDLLIKTEYRLLQGSLETNVISVVYDTRKELTKGALFLCIRGAVFDGHSYAMEAVSKGASVLVVEEEIKAPQNITIIQTPDSRKALAHISAAWFSYPAESLFMIGITGTKGKSTTAGMIRTILCKAGVQTDILGTIENTIGGVSTPATHSTPESYLLQEYLRKIVDAGTKCVVMEVSSQGLKLSRVEGIFYDIAVFTNLQPDHIAPGEHPDFEDYLYCKSLLFQQCELGIANVDDEHYEKVFQNASCKRISFGMKNPADFRASDAKLRKNEGMLGIEFCFCTPDGIKKILPVNIPGSFNVYNALAAATSLSCLYEALLKRRKRQAEFTLPELEKFSKSTVGETKENQSLVEGKGSLPLLETIAEGLSDISIRGRVELIPVSKHFSVMLDYAHNGMSLRSLLKTLREYEPKRLICMFGCGGNRAKGRRFEMGEISSQYADLTVITSDNPRFEEPKQIIADIVTGVKKRDGAYLTILDRKEAIHHVLSIAQEGDLVVIAGKGHEDYQEIKGIKYPMDDKQMILEAGHELGLC